MEEKIKKRTRRRTRGVSKNIVVVMGGSFNPPTAAHYALMRAALDEIGARKGVFVPSSHEYVSKKMAKSDFKDAVIPEELRFRMLSAMAKKDSRMSVDDLEYHREEKAYTFETLLDISRKHPEDEIYFLAGGDKVDIFPRWHRIGEFLERFKIITVKREGDDPASEIARDEFLSAYRDRFYIMEAPEGLDGISSSAVRAAMRDGRTEDARATCRPEVFKLLCQNTDPHSGVICGFFDEYRFLSNFWEAPVEYGGITYLNNEAAFQAQKCVTNKEKLVFADLAPKSAKALGRRVQLREDWEEVKFGIMEDIVRAKFTQNPHLAELLLATGEKPLLEGNTWNDTCWGVSLTSYKGKNHLGQILIKVRSELRESTV